MSFLRILFLLLLTAGAGAFLLSPVGTHVAQAQEPVVVQDVTLEQKAADHIADVRKRLDALAADVERRASDDAALTDIKVRVDSLIRDVLKVSVDLRPRLNEIKSRLDQLGEPPKDGQPAEAPAVTQERHKLTANRLEINTLTGQAEDISIKASELSNRITKMRRDLFAEQLFAHTEISMDVFSEAASSFSNEASDFQRTLGSWVTFILKFKRVPLGIAVMLSLSLALVLMFVEYRLFGRLIKRDPAIEAPTYMSRLSVAFWSTILPTLALCAFLAATYFFLDTFKVLRQDVAPMMAVTFAFAGLVVFVGLLTQAVLAPKAPTWRLIRVSDRGARHLVTAVLLMAVINGLDYVFGTISEALGSPVVLTVFKSFLSSTLVGLIIFAVSFMTPVVAETGDARAPGRPWPRWVAISLRLVGLGLIFLSAVGYVGLARFLATQIIVNGAVVVTMYIGILSGKAISEPDRFGDTRVGRHLERRFLLNPVALDQTGMAAGLLIYLFALSIGIPLILISWGFQPGDIEAWLFTMFTEVNVGSIRFSVFGILGGILLFVLGLIGTRWFQKWLDGSIMARSQVDPGVRNSVRTAIGYLGTALAGLIGVSAAGIDLSSLALVAGALSLGIGFGLQNIVSNFVSGLILLAERPFKVGDWVATGTTEGFVRRISVRATEIETFQRQSIIVPNSELINASVGNWTHRNSLGRVDIPVGVSYDSDPRQVMAILEEIGQTHDGVLRNPEPFVIFDRFGPSSLDFRLCFFIGDVLNSRGVKNDIHVTILERFRAEGIGIPFPQQDVHLHMRPADDARRPGERRGGGGPMLAAVDELPGMADDGLPADEASGNLLR
nr:mechanosensitive ion channel family protein [Ciceribacter ferrooxidans]